MTNFNVKNAIISSSPFLVSVPFTITGMTRFSESEPKALWQPPGYVFATVWPIIYVLMFMFNSRILNQTQLPLALRQRVKYDTIFESVLQGIWLYVFRYQSKINGRYTSQYIGSLIVLTGLWGFALQRIRTIHKMVSPNIFLELIMPYLPYVLWIGFANILGIQLTLGITK
jgi:tryptophan-rich sensory protein